MPCFFPNGWPVLGAGARLGGVVALGVWLAWAGHVSALEPDAKAASHWAFAPLGTTEPPSPRDGGWGRTPIDAFILQRLETAGLRPNAPLDRRRLIRRVYFDVLGSPPAPEQVRAFVSDPDPDAYARLVDQLLDHPAYGERWGRHWLDLARYADSDGQEADRDRPTAYHYRDFVIRALNEDMPYDRFVRWQIAGDEMAPDDPMAIAATGFLVAGPRTLLDVPMEEEKLRNRYNELDDMISTTGLALLGLSVGCARCHDHKFDPIPTRDYYRLMAVFHSGDRAEVPLVSPAARKSHREQEEAWKEEWERVHKEQEAWFDEVRRPLTRRLRDAKVDALALSAPDRRRLKTPAPEDRDRVKELERKHARALEVTEEDYLSAIDEETAAEWRRRKAELDALKAREPEPLPTAFAMRDFGGTPKPTFVFARGDFRHPEDPVDVGFLSALMHGRPPETYLEEATRERPLPDSTYQRKALALWVTDLDHGAGALLARVIVNRLWQHHMGAGLVRTVNDFGHQGEPASHPELLEWMARDLVSGGWSLKRMHRQILLSATYRLDVAVDEAKAAVDPDNRLWWRRRPLRLEAEILRDAMLSVSGTLNEARYGPAFYPPIAVEAQHARNLKSPYPRQAKDEPATRRRTVYMFHKRVIQYPLMQAFDAPDATASCGRRLDTTVAPQGLAILNDPFVRLRAGDFAERLEREAGEDAAARVRRAFWLALGRAPTDAERDASVSFLRSQAAAREAREACGETGSAGSRHEALADYCQAMLGLNEFIYVD